MLSSCFFCEKLSTSVQGFLNFAQQNPSIIRRTDDMRYQTIATLCCSCISRIVYTLPWNYTCKNGWLNYDRFLLGPGGLFSQRKLLVSGSAIVLTNLTFQKSRSVFLSQESFPLFGWHGNGIYVIYIYTLPETNSSSLKMVFLFQGLFSGASY